MYLAIATDGCNQWCRRQWCKCTAKSFDLLNLGKIPEKSGKSGGQCPFIWKKWRFFEGQA